MDELEDLLAEIRANTKVISLADLNPMQRRAVEDFRDRRVLDWQETKQFELTRSMGGIFLYMIVGSIGDEGTAAMILRRYHHIVVGPRGKIKILSDG